MSGTVLLQVAGPRAHPDLLRNAGGQWSLGSLGRGEAGSVHCRPRTWRPGAVASFPWQGKGQFVYPHSLAWGAHTTTVLHPCIADVISATANKVSYIRSVTGIHPFPSETQYSEVNSMLCQEHKCKSWHNQRVLGPLEWLHFSNQRKAGRSKWPQLKRRVL